MKNTTRFTKTVQDYIKARPSYPKEVLQVLIDECGLTKDSIIADIGSGTGLLTKLWLDHGNAVYGVEPNAEMRAAGEDYLKNYPQFHSIDGAAETTSLKAHSIDIVTAGTAFHWFDAEKTKIEFKRILKSPGWVLIVWNVRNMEQSSLLRDYETLVLKYGKGYRESSSRRFDLAVMQKFFEPYEMQFKSFKNIQQFDWAGLKSRLLSTSYSLRPEDAGYEVMLNELKVIFEHYQQKGTVEFLYDTKLYYGRFS